MKGDAGCQVEQLWLGWLCEEERGRKGSVGLTDATGMNQGD